MVMSFRNYLTEIFDKSFPYKRMAPDETTHYDDEHHYTFNDDKDQKFQVTITHKRQRKPGEPLRAEVNYGTPRKGGEFYTATKKSGMGAPKVLGTVKRIMKKHALRHRVGEYNFTAMGPDDAKRDSRKRLYDTIARKHGGTVSQSRNSGFGISISDYTIPTGIKPKKT